MPDTPYQIWLREKGLSHLDTPGLDIPLPKAPAKSSIFEPVKSTFGTILDVLNRPANTVASIALAAQKGLPIGDAAWKGLTGEEHHNFGEVLEAQGVGPGIGRTVGGLAADVLLDPTNLIPGSVLKKGFGAVQKGSRFLGEQASKIKAIDEALNAVTPGRELRSAGEAYQKNAAIREMEVRAARGKAGADAEERLRDKYLSVRQHVGRKPEELEQSLKRTAHAIEGGPEMVTALHPSEQAVAQEMLKFGPERASIEGAEGILRPDHLRDNYLPHSYLDRPGVRSSSQTGVLGDPAFERLRKFDTLAEAEKEGFNPDYNLMRLMSSRQFSGDRAIIYNKFIGELTRQGTPELPNAMEHLRVPLKVEVAPGQLVDNPQIPKDFATVRLPWRIDPASTFGVEKYAFHPAVAQDLEKMFTIKPQPGAVGRAFDAVQNMWKPLATVVRPAFVQRNVMSNMYMSIAGDMNPLKIPERYAEATKLLLPETLHHSFGKAYRGNAAKYADDVTLGLAKRFGVVGTQFGAVGEIGQQAERALADVLSPTKNIVKHTSPIEIGRNVSQFSEDVGRLALFIDQLDKKGLNRETLQGIAPFLIPGGTKGVPAEVAAVVNGAMSAAKDSALHVNKWLLNYAVKTPFEHNVASRLIPFYTWARRIMPLLLETSATKPGLISFQEKLKNEIEGSVPDDVLMDEGRRPAWMQEQGYAQLPSSTARERKFGSFGLPGSDLNQIPVPFLGSSIARAGQEFLSKMTPAKAGIEALINRNISTGGDIWSNDPGELKQASGTLTALAEISPQLAHALGMAKVGNVWMAPARMNYLSAQAIPVAEQVGKGLRGTMPGQQPEEDSMRYIMNMLSALPNVQRDTPMQEKKRLMGEKREQKGNAKVLARQLASQRREQ